MKRKLTSLLCVLVFAISMIPSASALEGEALRAADTLAALNLVDSAGAAVDYNLNNTATRAQAAQLLVRLAGAEDAAQSAGSSGFQDVPAWAEPYVAYAARQGWVSGVSAQNFAPDSAVTANTWCAMVLRMLGYSDADGDFTVSEAAVFAQRIGLTSQSYTGTLTRGDVFQIMRDALTFPYQDGSGTVIERLVETGTCTRATANALGLLDTELTAREIADRYTAAVFCLDLYETQQEIDAGVPAANASGFFISSDGVAVTNYHSIDGGIYALVTLSTGESYPVEEVLYYDPEIDIAVLRVSKTSTAGSTTSAFACLELAGTEDLRPGDTVYALSNPLGLGLAVSSGVVSAVGREVDSYALPCVLNTADISRGSSGGALLNAYGQAVAVTTGAYTYGNSMYLGVPVDPVMSADLTAHSWTLAEVKALEADREDAA